MSTQAEDHLALIAALGQPRLVPSLAQLGWQEILGLVGLGLLIAWLIGLALSPLLRRRVSVRARIRATRGLPAQERILSIARILGRLPEALRSRAYDTSPPTSDAEIERLARRR